MIWGNLNEVYPIRIKGEPRYEGTNTVYQVELFGANSKGIPVERLLAGERFSVGYAPVEKDLSRKAGDVRFQTPVSMRNEFSTIRIQHKVGGNMLNKKLAVGIPIVKETAGGGLTHSVANMWMHYVDYEVELQFSEYKNNALAWGVSNRNNNGEYLQFGDSGDAIKTGSGLFEQMEVGNTMYYNSTDNVMKLILDALYELSASKLDFKDRKFLLKTGERGALLFNREAKKTTSGWMPLMSTQNPAYFSRNNTKYAPETGLSVTDYQVTEWKAPNGVTVTLDIDPINYHMSGSCRNAA